MTNKRALYIITSATLAALLLALLLPSEQSGRYAAVSILVPIAVFTFFYLKKRSIPSINQREVTLVIAVFSVVYLMIYYMTGLIFGFVKNIYILNFSNFLSFILPITAVIIASEVLRYVVSAQNEKGAKVLCYLSCVIAQVLLYGNIHYINSFNRFMDLIGLTLFPAIVSNFVFGYMSARYGMIPNIIYRLATTLYLYLIPFVPDMADSLFAVYNLIFPLIIYAFISTLYEKKNKHALVRTSKFAVVSTVIFAIMAGAIISLTSNQFRFGTLIIATPSMTGELNVGDAAIFEKYADQQINEGQVIVFENNGNMVIHRVVEIETVNGQTAYITRGDANNTNDQGYITKSDIIGLVNMKIPYVGYPTLWLRSLYER